MARFRRKPEEIDAILYTGTNRDEVLRFMFPGIPPDQVGIGIRDGLGGLPALDLPGVVAQPGSWIFRDLCGQGYFHAVRQAAFAEDWEEIPDGSWRDRPPLL